MTRIECTSGLNQIAATSQKYGINRDTVIAGGGNTSFITNTHKWINACGVALETIAANGFVCLNRKNQSEINNAPIINK